MSLRKTIATTGDPSRDLKITMSLLLPLIVLCSAIYFRAPDQPFALVPLILFALWRFMPKLGPNSDQRIFLGFFVVCYMLDDTAWNPWIGKSTITEVAGDLLFKSFGVTGMEAFVHLFTLFIIVTTRWEAKQHWMKLGIHKFLMIPLAVLVTSILASAYGIAKGGQFETAMIQIRYIYLLPLWCFIGFTVIRSKEYFEKLIFWLTVVVVIKSFQGFYIWVTNRDYYREAEYLYDHHFSAYAVAVLFALFYYLYKYPSKFLRFVNVSSIGIVLVVLKLNERRTATAAAIFTIMALVFLLPPNILRRWGRTMLFAGVVGLGLLAASWKIPVIGPDAILKGFKDNPNEQGPSYRDLENANIMREVARAPLTGLGYGHEFDEVYMMPSIVEIYARYKMNPHNAFLATWSYGGPLTMTAASLYILFMITTAGRMVSSSYTDGLRFIGVVTLCFFIEYFSFFFGDLGLQVNRLALLGGVFIGGVVRLLLERQEELKNG